MSLVQNLEAGKLYTFPLIKNGQLSRGRIWNIPKDKSKRIEVLEERGIGIDQPFMVLSWVNSNLILRERSEPYYNSSWWWVEVLTDSCLGWIELEQCEHLEPFQVTDVTGDQNDCFP